MKPRPRFLTLRLAALLAGLIPGPACAAPSGPIIFDWERGIGLRIPGEPMADMFLWFYEWTMFEAVEAGQHAGGTHQFDRKVNATATEAEIVSPALRLTVRAVPDGAELVLQITNRTGRRWPEIAGIIPCWNPGQVPASTPSSRRALNRNFSDPGRRKSFFVSAAGLEPLVAREIHFNSRLRSAVDRAAENGAFVFTSKWPTSDINASAGLLVRESEDSRWVTGIGWEDFLSLQGHNPWDCLHACVRVGPLNPGESRTVRGKLYLFRGAKEDCLARFCTDFPSRR